MEDKFLGCDIELIKPIQGDIIGKKIVVSTCYFLNDSFNFSDQEKVLNYLLSLIDNLEVFQYKINAFCNPVNTWIYRVYIDSIVFEIPEIIDKLKDFTEQNNANEKLNKIHENLLENRDLLMFISNFLKKYIDTMQTNPKYDKIEIYTYRNDKILSHLLSNPNLVVGGHLQTFGTLLRFHPITEKNVDICIMRNCSTSLTPLDLVIQDYWINYTELPYMEYKSDGYSFVKKGKIFGYEQIEYQPSQEIMRKLFPSIDPYNLRRSFAGLIGCRINPETRTSYKEKLNKLRNEYIMRNNLKINSKYQYGIDEGIIPLIFEELGNNELQQNIYTVNLVDSNISSLESTIHVAIIYYANYINHPFYKWSINQNKKFKPTKIINRSELEYILPDQYSFLWNIYSASLLSEWFLRYKYNDEISSKSIGKYLSIGDLNDIKFLLKSVDWLKKPVIDFQHEEKSNTIKYLSDLTDSFYQPEEDHKEIQTKLNKYLFITSINVTVTGQVDKLLEKITEQFTEANFRPFLVIPTNITINGSANPPEVATIRQTLINYAESQPPIQVGGAKYNYRRKLSRKAKRLNKKNNTRKH